MFDRDKYVDCFSRLRAPEDTLNKAIGRLGGRRLWNISRTGLIAAVLVPLFVLTALAAGLSGMFTRILGEGEKLAGRMRVSTYGGELEEKNLDIDGVSLCLSFDIRGECKKVYFRPGWLPGEKHPSYTDDEGYSNIIYGTEGNHGDILCSITLYTGEKLTGTNYFFFGETRLLVQDDWLDWQRLEVEQSLPAGEGENRKNNFLLLFSPEHSYLLVIAGEETAGTDMEDLERVARELEINVTDKPTIAVKQKTDFANINLAWG